MNRFWMDQHLLRLFQEFADAAPEERERALIERQIPPDVRAELESLLRFDSFEDQSITECVSAAAAEVLSGPGQHPDRCGPYRLVRSLGSGGMGSVWLAERTDGEIQQQVAVKLLSAGGNRPEWRARFLKERQILASLHHPSIVHVIDAGHTAGGQPYLAMEYVEGVAIDAFAAPLELRDRLALFLRVCEGVSHAHRHLIIHRDLKPSNILVDASGQPKLLDFGIARLVDETGDATQERMLTPNYASPEQLSGANQTTATDVYSLGVVLYELLTGRSPHEPDRDASRPGEVTARTREILPPTRLNSGLPGDLDYIVRKALRSEPEERYVSVDAFANDIRAFLECRSVEARSGNAWYRTRKFLRRYWMPVTAASVVIASLATGLYVANRERAIAQRRFGDVRQLSNKLFEIDAQARQLPGSAKTRQLLVDTSLEYLRRLAEDARRDPEFALELGNAYLQVARVQGVPTTPNLGQMAQAGENLKAAEGLMQTVLAAQPGNRTAILRSAEIAYDQLLLLRYNARYNETGEAAHKVVNRLEKLQMGRIGQSEVAPMLTIYIGVARYYMLQQDLNEALRLSNRGLSLARSMGTPAHLAGFHFLSAQISQMLGNLEEALRSIQEAVQKFDPGTESPLRGQQTMNFVMALICEGNILGKDNAISLGRSQDAVIPLERAFRITDGLVHQDSRDEFSRSYFAAAGLPFGSIISHSDPKRALSVYDHVLQHLAELKDNASFRRLEVSVLASSTYPLRRLGHAVEARQRLNTAFQLLIPLKLYPAKEVSPNSEARQALSALADLEADMGNVNRAIEIYQELLDLIAKSDPQPETILHSAVYISQIYAAKAALHRRAHQMELASALETRHIELWRLWERKLPNNEFVQRQISTR